jgi:hypothetical protein
MQAVEGPGGRIVLRVLLKVDEAKACYTKSDSKVR